MQEVFNFIFSHYEAILSVLTLIISIVVLILRKKPINDVFTQIYNAVLIYVKEAELQYPDKNKGYDKFSYVVLKTTQYLRDIYPGINAESYVGVIAETIEKVLSTPQKKEDK